MTLEILQTKHSLIYSHVMFAVFLESVCCVFVPVVVHDTMLIFISPRLKGLRAEDNKASRCPFFFPLPLASLQRQRGREKVPRSFDSEEREVMIYTNNLSNAGDLVDITG